MSESIINLGRFRACRELEKRGVTAGEREAGRAAAARVAAGAGLEFAEAVQLAEENGVKSGPSTRPRSAQKKPKAGQIPPASPPKSKPATIAELPADRQAKAERFRKRVEREMCDAVSINSKWQAEAREVPAQRDREWAAAKGPAKTGG